MRSPCVFLFIVITVCLIFIAATLGKRRNMSIKPKFALVSWLEDNSVGVVPLSAAKDGEKVFPGATIPVKFQRKYYEAEILKISGNKTELNKNCKDLAEFTLTREDFLSSETPELEHRLEEDILEGNTPYRDPPTVDSTTAEKPPATKRPKSTKMVKKQKKPTTSAAKITAAKERASRMFKERKLNVNKDSREDCSIISVDRDATQWKPQATNAFSSAELLQGDTTQLKPPATNAFLSAEMLQGDPTMWKPPATNAFSSAELLQMLEAQKKEIEELQTTLRQQKAGKVAPSPPAPWPYEQTEQAAPLLSTPQMQTGQAAHMPLNAGYSVPQAKYTKNNAYSDEQFMDENCYPEEVNFNSKWELTPTNPMNLFTKKVNKRLEYHSTAKIDIAAEKSQNPLQEKVELVPGYNVYISPRQLDEVVSASGGRPTRLMRALLTAFFSNNTLASSCALGSRERPAINPNIRDACIKYVQSNYKEIARTALIDTINDKCAQCRRSLKRTEAM